MDDIRRILVPVDFSENSLTTLSAAAAVARVSGARIDLIHVWQMPSFLPPEAFIKTGQQEIELQRLIQRRVDGELDQLVARAAERGIAVAERRTECGVPSEVIVDVAKSGRYDLVVMSTHGRTGFSRAFLGSVAERVLRHAPCPVLTVRGTREV